MQLIKIETNLLSLLFVDIVSSFLEIFPDEWQLADGQIAFEYDCHKQNEQYGFVNIIDNGRFKLENETACIHTHSHNRIECYRT